MSAPLVGTEGAGGGRREKSWEREPGKGGGTWDAPGATVRFCLFPAGE